jgi:hypothetical protein
MKLALGLATGKHHRHFQVLAMHGVGTEMDEEG